MKQHFRALGITILVILLSAGSAFSAMADTQADFDQFLQDFVLATDFPAGDDDFDCFQP